MESAVLFPADPIFFPPFPGVRVGLGFPDDGDSRRFQIPNPRTEAQDAQFVERPERVDAPVFVEIVQHLVSLLHFQTPIRFL